MSTAARIQKWTWILIYIGMVSLALGLSVQRSDAALGWGIAVPGIVLIVVGAVLIWVRSRMKNTKETP
jgi:membrane protein DedA with SNARE-associated domain